MTKCTVPPPKKSHQMSLGSHQWSNSQRGLAPSDSIVLLLGPYSLKQFIIAELVNICNKAPITRTLKDSWTYIPYSGTQGGQKCEGI